MEDAGSSLTSIHQRLTTASLEKGYSQLSVFMVFVFLFHRAAILAEGIFILAIGHFTKRHGRYFLFWTHSTSKRNIPKHFLFIFLFHSASVKAGKVLPSRQMIRGYADSEGVAPGYSGGH